MKAFPVYPSSSGDGAPPAIVRLVRRICLLSEQGDEPAAERLEQERLAPAVRDFREQHGPGALSEQKLAEIFVEEHKRAADAVVLAELLLSQLAARESTDREPVPPAGPAIASAGHRRIEPHTSIPDLLDVMLAGEAARRRRS